MILFMPAFSKKGVILTIASGWRSTRQPGRDAKRGSGAKMSTKEVKQKYEKVRKALDELYWAIERLERGLQQAHVPKS
jgi:hypothetical protein